MNRLFKCLPLAAIVSLFFSQMAFSFAPTFTYEQVRGRENFACHALYPSGFKEVVPLDNCRTADPDFSYEEVRTDFFACVATYTTGFSENVHRNYCRNGAEYKYEPFLDTDTKNSCVASYDSGLSEIVHLNFCRDQNPTFKYEPLVPGGSATCVATHSSGYRETVPLNKCRN